MQFIYENLNCGVLDENCMKHLNSFLYSYWNGTNFIIWYHLIYCLIFFHLIVWVYILIATRAVDVYLLQMIHKLPNELGIHKYKIFSWNISHALALIQASARSRQGLSARQIMLLHTYTLCSSSHIDGLCPLHNNDMYFCFSVVC